MKRLFDILKDCKKEEEVKSEFCKVFKMKINALKAIDHYTETVLFEFKYDRNFKNWTNVATVVAQTMYYARLLKFSLTKYPLPPHICVVDKNEAFFIETKTYAKFYAEIVNTNWIDYKIETWDVGYYQICQALKGTGIASEDIAALKSAHDALRAKLLPKVYEYGFLNPDVQFYEG